MNHQTNIIIAFLGLFLLHGGVAVPSSVRVLCENDFVCPPHSTRKPGRSCYDSMEDCACDQGYFREGNTCTAKFGLCTDEYGDVIDGKIETVGFYLRKFDSTPNSQKATQVAYIVAASDAYADAWDAYTQGAASCEVFGEDSDGRFLREGAHHHRRLFGRFSKRLSTRSRILGRK